MSNVDFLPSLEAKGFYRFTGPPEHWLTAIKYMTWGLEYKYLDRWKEIQVGDVFLIHSTAKSFFPNAKSGIIGLGIVGPEFSTKENFLWLYELQNKANRWPLLVPFSELYIFSELPSVESWESPNLSNLDKSQQLIDRLLKNSIPLSKINGFPQMGSFSAVSKDVAFQVLSDKRPLFAYTNIHSVSSYDTKPTKLLKVSDVSETLRYADSLKPFLNINARVVKENTISYEKDNELLAKAEKVHASVLQQLIDIFKSKGYDTLSNRFVDLFAYKENSSFLLEVKSTENNNFRNQARKGIVQLYEYNHFEIKKFAAENKYSLTNHHKIFVPSQIPKDDKYVSFMNEIDIGVGTVQGETLSAIGYDFELSHI